MEIARNWQVNSQCDAHWLFVQLHQRDRDADTMPEVAQHIWQLATECQRLNIIFELSGELFLTSYLVGQIVLLHKRCHTAGGMFRLCGIPEDSYGVFRAMQLHERLPNYPTRDDAMWARKPQ